MNTLIKDYFKFTRKERSGIFILLLLIVAVIVLPYWFVAHTNKNNFSLQELKQLAQQLDTLRANDSAPWTANNAEAVPPRELFYFNPNTLDVAGWQQLGVRERTAQSIRKYCSKGGKFRKPEDLKKIWGLRAEEVARLIPFVQIPADNSRNRVDFVKKEKASPLDINLCTAYELGAFPVLLTNGMNYRIVKFRAKLGGFISIEQVKETYGMTDSIFQIVMPYLRSASNATVKQLNINTATYEELGAHPYISRYIAKAITNTRERYGSFTSLEELKKIKAITPALFEKIKPYVTVE